MIFKRKQAKPLEIGDFCTINDDIINNISSTKSYRKNSAHFKAAGYSSMHSSLFAKNKKEGNKLYPSDCTLFLVKEYSFLSKDLLVVLPVIVRNDSYSLDCSNLFIDNDHTFILDKNSLSLSTTSRYEELLNNHSEYSRDILKATVNTIKTKILEKNNTQDDFLIVCEPPIATIARRKSL